MPSQSARPLVYAITALAKSVPPKAPYAHGIVRIVIRSYIDVGLGRGAPVIAQIKIVTFVFGAGSRVIEVRP